MDDSNKCLMNQLNQLFNSTKLGKPKVLMVDDDIKNLTSFRDLFRREFNVFIASNKSEALSAVKNNVIDFVFCDYRMPKINGSEIMKEIVSINPNIGRSIVTAYADVNMLREFKKKSKTSDLIVKPYSLDDILSRVNSYC